TDYAYVLVVPDGVPVCRSGKPFLDFLTRLSSDLAVDRNRDYLTILVRAEVQRVCRRDIVAIGDSCGPVLRGEVDIECRRATATGDSESHDLRAAVAFGDVHILDRYTAGDCRGIVINDGANALVVAHV